MSPLPQRLKKAVNPNYYDLSTLQSGICPSHEEQGLLIVSMDGSISPTETVRGIIDGSIETNETVPPFVAGLI